MAKSGTENETKNECNLEEPFKTKMKEMLETGASNPTGLSMSDWYYIQNHASKCCYCLEEFERLARKAREYQYIDGPTTLRK